MAYQNRKPDPKPPLNLNDDDYDIDEGFDVDPPELDFVFLGFLAGTVGLLIAPGSTGKSYWALLVAIALACKAATADLLGLNPAKRGQKVVFLAAEDPKDVIRRRQFAIGKTIGRDHLGDCSANLKIKPLLGKRPDIMDNGHFDEIATFCMGARLIIIDTLTKFHTMDENKNSDMSQFIATLDALAARTGAAILVLHHIDKNSARNGDGNQMEAARGASAITNDARWCGFLQRPDEEEAKFVIDPGTGETIENVRQKYVRFGESKANYSMPVEDVWYEKGDGGVLSRVDLVTIPAADRKQFAKAREDRKRMAEVARAARGDGVPLTPLTLLSSPVAPKPSKPTKKVNRNGD